MSNLFCLAFCMLASPGMALWQDTCQAERLFQAHGEAPAFLEEQKCIEIDITQSYDSLGVDVIYEWDFGDGVRAEGMKVNHCYEDFGRYRAELSVRIPDKDYVSPREMDLDILIKEGVSLDIEPPSEVSIKSPASFTARLSSLATYQLNNLYWDFGDGVFSCGGTKTLHTYEKPGTYRIRTLAALSGDEGEVYLLSEKDITVKGFNISGAGLNAYFNKENSPPFVDKPVRLVALDEEGRSVKSLEIFDRDYLFILPPGKKYTLCLWKGNKLAKLQHFNAGNLEDSLDSFEPVADQLKKMTASPPTVLQPVFFEYNDLEPDQRAKRTIKTNVKILESLPFVQVTVGSYTHTEGTREINFAYSKRRSENVRREMLSNAKDDAIVVEAISPEDEESLINTCFEDADCGKENESLNRRTDFKIKAVGKP